MANRSAAGSRLIDRRTVLQVAAALAAAGPALMREGQAAARPPVFQRALGELHRFFLLGTILVVWIEHRAVFEAASYNFSKLRDEALCQFSDWSRTRWKWAAEPR